MTTVAEAANRVHRFLEAWTRGAPLNQRDPEVIYGLAVMPEESRADNPMRELLVSDLRLLVADDDGRAAVSDLLSEHLAQMKNHGGSTVTLSRASVERMVRLLERSDAE